MEKGREKEREAGTEKGSPLRRYRNATEGLGFPQAVEREGMKRQDDF